MTPTDSSVRPGAPRVSGLVALALVLAALLLVPLASASPTASFASNPAQLVVSGGFLGAQLSTNGEWLLFSQGSAPTGDGSYRSKVYLWRAGRTGRRLVGHGVAEAVSNDGQTIVYLCAESVVCIKRVDQATVRRVSVRCPFSPPVVDVAGSLKSLIYECTGGASPTTSTHTLVQIGSAATTAERLPGRSLTLRGVSTDGRTAVFEARRAVEVYKNGRLKAVPGISELGSVSSNGRFLIGSSAERVQQTCPDEDPTKELGFAADQPVIADLQTNQQHSIPASELCLGQPVAVSDDGRSVVYSNRHVEGCPSCAALVLVDVSTGQMTTLATNPSLGYGDVQFGSDGTVSWVRGGFPQALFVLTYGDATHQLIPRG